MEINPEGMSFQFQPETPRTGGVGASGVAPALGIGGGQSRVGVQRYQEAQTLGNPEMPEFLAAAFAPKLEAAKQEKFWSGFAAARSGKSQQEIADEQPWYTNIFGPTDYELGAQKFGVDRAMAEVDNKFTQDMHRLRQLPPEEIGKELNTIASSMMTGNVFTDALIQKGLMERGGVMLDAHAKARYEWQQGELSIKRIDAWTAQSGAYNDAMVAAATLGRQHPNQAETSEQRYERSRILLDGFAMSDYENPEAYQKDFATFVVGAANAGHWNTLNALEDSKAYQMLPPANREALMGQIAVARNKFKANLPVDPEMYRPLTLLNVRMRQGLASAEEVIGAMKEFDLQYTARTGDREGYFDLKDYEAGGTTAMTAMYNAWEAAMKAGQARRDAATTAAEKAAAEGRMTATLASAIGTGNAGTVNSIPGVKVEQVDQAFMAALGTEGVNSPNLGRIAVTEVATPVVGKLPFVSPTVKALLQGQAEQSGGENWTPAFETAYQNWKNIRYYELDLDDGKVDRNSGTVAARLYFGEHHDRMQQYHNMRRGAAPLDAEYAYRAVYGQDASRASLSVGVDGVSVKDQRLELAAVVKAQGPGMFDFGSDDLGRSGQNQTLDAMAPVYARLKKADPGLSSEDAAEMAFSEITANGWETAGKYAWQNVTGQKPLHATLDMSEEVFEEHFDDLVTARLRRAGVEVNSETSVTVIRIGDEVTRPPVSVDGSGKRTSGDDIRTPRMLVLAVKDGVQVSVALTGDDIEEIRKRKREAEVWREQVRFAPESLIE